MHALGLEEQEGMGGIYPLLSEDEASVLHCSTTAQGSPAQECI